MMTKCGYLVKGSNTTSVYEGKYVFDGREKINAMAPTYIGVWNFV